MPAQAAPAIAPAQRIAGTRTHAGSEAAPRTTATPAAAPTSNCPSAPMLNTPARNAMATASPVRISGVAWTRVPDPNAYHDPNAPARSARRASPITLRAGAGAPETNKAPDHSDAEDRAEREHGEQPAPADEIDNRIDEQRTD